MKLNESVEDYFDGLVESNFVEYDIHESVYKIISENDLISSPLGSYREMMISDKQLVIPKKYIKLIKSSIIYAKIYIYDFLDDEDFMSDYEIEEIEYLQKTKARIQAISDTFQNINHTVILHYEAVNDILFVLNNASKCLDVAYYEVSDNPSIFNYCFCDVSESFIMEKYKLIIGLYKKIISLYDFGNNQFPAYYKLID